MKNLLQIGCFYCEHRTPYDPDTDYCKLLDRKFENRLCMTVCRLKDCPLREVENNDNIIKESDNEKEAGEASGC